MVREVLRMSAIRGAPDQRAHESMNPGRGHLKEATGTMRPSSSSRPYLRSPDPEARIQKWTASTGRRQSAADR